MSDFPFGFMFATAGCIAFFAWGFIIAESNSQKEAVEHNAAHWIVKSDGTTTFHWNDEKDSK